jgi:glycosyltransferase involved in cell wall biosynthesis
MEAMASGVPVVASRVGGLPDLVLDGETGLLVPPGSAEALGAAIQRLVQDPGMARRMGAAGRDRVPSFMASTVIARLEKIYGELLSPS